MTRPIDQQSGLPDVQSSDISNSGTPGAGTVAGTGDRATASDIPFGKAADPAEIGTLGPYRVIRQLGRGGMGAVFLATDTRLNRKLALKVMLPQYAADKVARERFLREAQAAAQISHDNVVTVYEADERDGVTYIAMQFLQGYPLDEYLKKKGKPAVPQVIRLAREAAAGLAAAHKLGLVHRDIKPANLWLEAPNGRVKLLDFGLAKPLAAQVEMTQSGIIMGTPAYMSPEQARGSKVDGRTDLFSLGAMLYQLCTGKLPFEGPNVMAVLTALATENPRPVRELNPDVPAALADLIHQLLSKKPADRPAAADEVVRRLRSITEDHGQNSTPVGGGRPAAAITVTAAPEPDPWDRLDQIDVTPQSLRAAPVRRPGTKRRSGQRRQGAPTWLWIAASAACVVFGIFGLGLMFNRDATSPPDPSTAVAEGLPEVGMHQTESEGSASEQKVVPASTDPDRAAASWVLSAGGSVLVNGEQRMISSVDDLPSSPFVVTTVILTGRPVTDADLTNLKELKYLTELILTETSITGEGLRHLKHLPGLAHLWLKGTRVTDSDLQQLKEFRGLVWLSLANTGVTDDGLTHLATCRGLEELGLDGTPITDAGLAHLANLNRLRTIWLNNTAITDAGVAHLKSHTALTRLNLLGTGVTAAGIADLQAVIPGCIVELDENPISIPDGSGLRAAWRNNLLVIRGDQIPGREIHITYVQSFARQGSTYRDWDLETNMSYVTELVSASPDGREIRLETRLEDGVLIDHLITVGDDEVDFRLTVTNPTTTDSIVEWAEPCVRVDRFTGTAGADPRAPQPDYLKKCFVFIDGALTRLPTEPWATEARYTPGQVFVPAGIDRDNVNPRPISPLIPSSGLTGVFSLNEQWILATAWEPYQSLSQGVHLCMHPDLRIGGVTAGKTKTIRGKLYVVPADVEALVKRYEGDFPEQH